MSVGVHLLLLHSSVLLKAKLKPNFHGVVNILLHLMHIFLGVFSNRLICFSGNLLVLKSFPFMLEAVLLLAQHTLMLSWVLVSIVFSAGHHDWRASSSE
jgi:E3 ubiquitin-protein ligase DOA10